MYDQISKEYDNFFSKKEEYQKDIDGILNILEESSDKPVFLDYGCGTGGHIEYLLKKIDCTVVCFDISSEMMKFTKEKLKHHSSSLIFVDSFRELFSYEYDCIFSLFYVVNHFKNESDWANFASLQSCLKDKGKLIFDYYNYDVVINDPPVSYERKEKFSKKPHIKKCSAFLNKENIIMNYEIYDINKENLILGSKLNMRLWKEDFMKGLFQNKKIEVVGKNLESHDIDTSYHKVLVIS